MSAQLTQYFWIFLTATLVILILAVGLVFGFFYWNNRVREAQNFSSVLIEHLPIPLLILDTAGKIISMNKTFEQLFGLYSIDLTGKSVSRLSVLPEMVIDSITTGEFGADRLPDRHGPARVRTATGEEHVIKWSWTTYPREGTSYSKIILYARDVTKLHESEKTLQHWEALLHSSPDIMMILDSQGDIIFVTSSVKKYLGYSPKDLEGNGWWIYTTTPEDTESRGSKDYIARAARGAEKIPDTPYTQTINHSDGTPVQIRWQDKKGPNGLFFRYGRIENP